MIAETIIHLSVYSTEAGALWTRKKRLVVNIKHNRIVAARSRQGHAEQAELKPVEANM